MNILLTGATGFLGFYIVQSLLSNGHQIQALKRKSSTIDHLPIHPNLTWVEADMFEIATLEEQITNVDVLIHAAAFVSFARRDRKKLFHYNQDGTAALVDFALKANVKRFVYISSVAAVGRSNKNQRVDESNVWEQDQFNSYYGWSKFKGELEVWRGQNEGLQATILNPSLILGSGNWASGSPGLLTSMDKYSMFYPKGMANVVDVLDVAQSVTKVIDHESSIGNRYIINGHSLSYKDLFSEISQKLDVSTPRWVINPQYSRFYRAFDISRSILFNKNRTLTKDIIYGFSANTIFSNTKSIEKLGITYQPLESTLHRITTSYLESKRSNVTYKFDLV